MWPSVCAEFSTVSAPKSTLLWKYKPQKYKGERCCVPATPDVGCWIRLHTEVATHARALLHSINRSECKHLSWWDVMSSAVLVSGVYGQHWYCMSWSLMYDWKSSQTWTHNVADDMHNVAWSTFRVNSLYTRQKSSVTAWLHRGDLWPEMALLREAALLLYVATFSNGGSALEAKKWPTEEVILCACCPLCPRLL